MSALAQTAVEVRRAAGRARAGWSPLAWTALAAIILGAVVPFLSFWAERRVSTRVRAGQPL